MKTRAPRPGAPLAASEEAPFRALVKRWGRLSQVERDILRGFSEAGDPSLRDTVLPRLEHDADMRDSYIEYFSATGREDPLVRARLKKMREKPSTPQTEDNLRRFFEEK